ncbi:MAG: Spy/CpxP family protein refolding chaperone [Rhizobiales bacterium]|nr:Spy/CpxP family protein refolding chaperone [Hyphomicrobiales bacterium]
MKKVGAHLALAAFAFIAFASPPAAAFGLRLGPFHLGVPLFGHRHHHHPLYMHGNTHDVARHENPEVGRREASPAPQQRPVSLALLYPARALPAIFQNVFWPASSSPWPFGYDVIFTTAFSAAPADRNRDDCGPPIDVNAIVGRLRAEIGPSAEQTERLQRLGGAIGAAADYLAKSCPTEIPQRPTARLQLMDAQLEVLTMAVDIIHQPLQEFEQSLTDEQRAKFDAEPAVRRAGSVRSDKTEVHACGTSASAIDWSIGEIDKSVQPTEQQRTALTDVQQAFGKAANDLQTHCPTSVPRSAVARLETIESRLDATWRAILSIQVALQDFESKLSDDQKNRLQSMTFAAQ